MTECLGCAKKEKTIYHQQGNLASLRRELEERDRSLVSYQKRVAELKEEQIVIHVHHHHEEKPSSWH